MHLFLFTTHNLGTILFGVTKWRMMRSASTQEKIRHLYQNTRRHIPKDSNHRIQSREKIISQIQSRTEEIKSLYAKCN